MSESESAFPVAWEPITPRGVAAFAGAQVGRLWLVQLLVAGLAGAAVVGFLLQAWCPVVRAAIQALPATGELSGERLQWSGETPVLLAGNHFLGIGVDLNHSNQLGRGSHLQIEFGRQDVRIISLLGYLPLDYPAGWDLPFNSKDLGPWWGAWKPAILLAAGLGVLAGLLLVWTVLATCYVLPLRIILFLENRRLGWGQSWRMAGAALMPGALFMTFGICAYGVGLVDLIRLFGISVLHFAVGWAYLGISPLFLPRDPGLAVVKKNPFLPPAAPQQKEAAKHGAKE